VAHWHTLKGLPILCAGPRRPQPGLPRVAATAACRHLAWATPGDAGRGWQHDGLPASLSP